MNETVYRFLPWSRRGLSAALPAAIDGAPLPARPKVTIDVVVGGGAGPVSTTAQLHGPGDVIGLDPTVIVRTIPRPGSTNVESNYLAAVDFDHPELPWLFTPGGVPGSGHLRPWLVLVVVRDRPGVSVTVPRGAFLPHLTIESGAASELPDLADSWAWAHVQLLDEDAGASTETVAASLLDDPNRNVSRLVCPRRLEPDAAWIACLVPAFDAGVVRGFGGTPADANLKPAWSSPDAIELPVYYHWQFQTGPQGDFESLARRLKPYEASAQLGRVKMHVGDAAPPFVDLPTGDPGRFLDMDGALQAPAIARAASQPPVLDPTLTDVPAALRTDLEDISRLLADAADGKLDGQAPEDGAAIGPPVYAGGHIQRTSVTNTDDTWFRELNTDPRCRVAAGLGTEVLKRFQEDVMEACWQQVGDVIAIETALSRARLSLEAALRFRQRHLVPLPRGRLMQIAAPLSDRTLLDGLTLPKAIAPTSFPDRATDAAMRRYTAGRGRIVAGIARRAARDAATGAAATRVARAARGAGEQLVTTLAAGRGDVDATRFPVVAIDGLPAAMPPAAGGEVTLEPFGVAVTLQKADAAALTGASRALQAAPAPPAEEMLRLRADLRSSGLITSAHLAAARDVAAEQHTEQTGASGDQHPTVSQIVSSSSSSVVDAVIAAAVARPGDAGFLIETGRTIVVHPLAVRGSGVLVVVTPPGRANVPIARIDPRLHGPASSIGDLVARLPNGAIDRLVVRPGGVIVPPVAVELRPGAVLGDVVVGPGAGGPVAPAGGPGAPTVTMPPLVKDAATMGRYEEAVSELTRSSALAVDPVTPRLVSFDLAGAVDSTMERSNPIIVHPARLDTMISIAGHALSGILVDPSLAPAWHLPALLDRVMAYPRLDLPAYTYLAAYDRTRFCPGVDEVPPDSVTLLETNPRFIAGFMGGLNHETNRELLWRSFPTDGRGTPWRSFWKRTDARPDIFEIHTWGKRGNRDDLPSQTSDPLGNLVLLLRGDLLRRYPNTMAVAVRAVRTGGAQKPSDVPSDLLTPTFAGAFDPDVSFFGFPLVSADLTTGEGWFFGLMEPVTEPRFGFDETVGRETQTPTNWNDVAWPDLLPVPGHLTVSVLAGLGLSPSVGRADGVAAALFQRPFKLLIHARHLVKGI